MSWEAWGDPPDPPEMEPCPHCDGTGHDPEDDDDCHEKFACKRCNGEGEIEAEYGPLDDDVI